MALEGARWGWLGSRRDKQRERRKVGGSSGGFNVLAIVAFVLAFVVSLGSLICGHIALA